MSNSMIFLPSQMPRVW